MKVLGIVLVLLALAIGIVPHYTDCYSQGKLITLANGNQQPMKCHWSAQSEIAVAIPLVGVGAMLSLNRRKKSALSLSVVGVILGAMAIALPVGLIGTCSMPVHICNTAMKPSLLSLGSLAMASSVGVAILAIKTRD